MIISLLLSLALGWLVGYERYYNGRIAGTQVYCLVCMTSCAAVGVAGHPGEWFGPETVGTGDPTRVVGSVIAGIGFLGAGILSQTGASIRGLTTAASIWGTAGVGVLVGVNMPLVAVCMTLLFALCMTIVPWLEHRLPLRAILIASVRYSEGHHPDIDLVSDYLRKRGVSIERDTLEISFVDGSFEMEFVIRGSQQATTKTIETIASQLPEISYVKAFTLSHSSRG